MAQTLDGLPVALFGFPGIPLRHRVWMRRRRTWAPPHFGATHRRWARKER